MQATESQLAEMYDPAADDDRNDNADDTCLQYIYIVYVVHSSLDMCSSRSSSVMHSFCICMHEDDLNDCEIISSLQSMLGPALIAAKAEPDQDLQGQVPVPETSTCKDAQLRGRPVATPVRTQCVKGELPETTRTASGAQATEASNEATQDAEADPVRKRALDDTQSAENPAAAKRLKTRRYTRQDRPRFIAQHFLVEASFMLRTQSY